LEKIKIRRPLQNGEMQGNEKSRPRSVFKQIIGLDFFADETSLQKVVIPLKKGIHAFLTI
jgi:hypothetical protein